MNRRNSFFSKQEDSPDFIFSTQEDAHRLGKEKINMDRREMGNRGVFGSQCYWHDFRKEKHLFSKGIFGGTSDLVWGPFSASGKADLVVMERKKNSVRYINVL